MLKSISLVICIVFTILTAGIAIITKNRVDQLQSTLKSTKETLETTQATLAKTEATLKSTQEELKVANAKIDDQTAEIGTLTADVKAKTDKIAAQEAEIADIQKKYDEADAQLAELRALLGKDDPKMLKAQITGMTEQITDLQRQLEEAHVLQAKVDQQKKDADAAVASANMKIKHYVKQVALHSFQGRVIAVNPGWNFVVVDVGDSQGATMNAPLIVVRGGQNIAKARITSVEPRTSIADIIPSSLAKGQSIQPGDQIIFAGTIATDDSALPAPPTPAGGAPLNR